MNNSLNSHRPLLEKIARHAMTSRGLLADFSQAELKELERIVAPQGFDGGKIRDLRELQWSSIDNDDSRDLDQLAVAEELQNGNCRIFVAVADVESMVGTGTAIDEHARHNTTSIYTAAMIFPMLPEKLSTNLSSLNPDEDRQAIVIEMVIDGNGVTAESDVYRAFVRNHAKLAYNSVAAWLDGDGTIPAGVAANQALADNLRLQDKVAQRMKNHRHTSGALSLETIEARPVFEGDEIRDLAVEKPNRAKSIIEDFMIAANGVIARYLSSKNFPSLRRIVRTPKRWDRIVAIAAEHGFNLPDEPDSKALEAFLAKERASDPLRFPDLSLSVIKLMGPGEYVAELPGSTPSPGHFGLAVGDYTHSTAPNRRYPDLVTQRIVKAALSGKQAPYDQSGIEALARHCTETEDKAKKVERQVAKSAAALVLESRIGEQFGGIVTGAGPKGTWVRLIHPPVEGRLVHGMEGIDVGTRIHVELIRTDVERGFIDFAIVSR
jgi:VacB/RNase II family 3'-5' exoribonuclease